ncbi:hypothetical protein BLNAU_10793 [Blattamonas nauphoetae]|uniref:Uncharacterized protein n=1 Tax=Blattamonas nauphoetae TaxID=2049346 RepID=A0ABQ9XSK3_9EUKA|nr:hypothetical protein BLNAU_10793 [Blattamonas nauphoetae]
MPTGADDDDDDAETEPERVQSTTAIPPFRDGHSSPEARFSNQLLESTIRALAIPVEISSVRHPDNELRQSTNRQREITIVDEQRDGEQRVMCSAFPVNVEGDEERHVPLFSNTQSTTESNSWQVQTEIKLRLVGEDDDGAEAIVRTVVMNEELESENEEEGERDEKWIRASEVVVFSTRSSQTETSSPSCLSSPPNSGKLRTTFRIKTLFTSISPPDTHPTPIPTTPLPPTDDDDTISTDEITKRPFPNTTKVPTTSPLEVQAKERTKSQSPTNPPPIVTIPILSSRPSFPSLSPNTELSQIRRERFPLADWINSCSDPTHILSPK